MSTAARQRLKRFEAAGQPSLGTVIDDVVDPIEPAPASEADAQHHFETLAADLRPTFVPDDDPWATSPYAWVKQLPSASRGRAGVALIERWARSCGFDVTRCRGKRHDLLAGDDQVEVKMSTLWASGDYTFQAVRPEGYDTLILLGISPHEVNVWAPPRDVALANIERTAGGNGWITVSAAAPPPWLTPYGGSPAIARAVLAARWPQRRPA